MAVLTPLFEPEASKPKSRLSEIGSNAVCSRSPSIPLSPVYTLILRKDETKQVLLNNFHLSTLILLGCTLQGLLTYSLLSLHLRTLSLLSLLPPIGILTYRSLDVLLILKGWKKNRYMEDIIPGRVSAQVPDEKGEFGTEPSRETVVVLFLGLRTNQYVLLRSFFFSPSCLFGLVGGGGEGGKWLMVIYIGDNSPLGILSPGFTKMKDLFIDMTRDMEERREEFECM